MTDKLLEIKGLKQHFFTSKGTIKAVDGLTFDIFRGETLGLVGDPVAESQQQAERLFVYTTLLVVRCYSMAKTYMVVNLARSLKNSIVKCK